MKQYHASLKNSLLFLLDIVLCGLAYVISLCLVFPLSKFATYFANSISSIALTAVVYIFVLLAFKIYRIYWRYGSVGEYLRLLIACAVACIINLIADSIFLSHVILYPKFTLTANFVFVCLILTLRFAIRAIPKIFHETDSHKRKRILIIGAGRLSAMLLRDILENDRLNYKVVGLIDDNKKIKNQMMLGAKVLGTRNDIIRICRQKNVDEIIFAIYTIPKEEKQKILEICTNTGKKVKVMPGIEAMLSKKFSMQSVRNIEIEDLLERDSVTFDTEQIQDYLTGKTVLVTGGGGSIGSELCRQIIKFRPKLLIILDIYENTTYELENELKEKYPDQKLEFLIASVRDKKRLDEIFTHYRPEVVFHAAAHKHVPLMEWSPCEAIKNNVFGTLNVAKCADEFSVKRFIMISTDKAVNPTNVMGATKRMCEMIIQTMATKSKTEFVAVRFGNVLGSNGSVVPRFKKQIAAGGPVTVTHPEITRFFMTIPEAARLVLQAAVYASGGEIFVLDMGQPVKIYDLAKKIIRLSGYAPEKDIKIEFTGLRPGEKLYEELLMDEEGLRKTAHSKIFIGQPINIDEKELDYKLNLLSEALEKDDEAVKEALKIAVPTYHEPKAAPAKETENEPVVETVEETSDAVVLDNGIAANPQ